jgi:very-short-patch-repair endonuclease
VTSLVHTACRRGVSSGRRRRVSIDIGYDEQKVLVELDGLAFHGDSRFRAVDTRRDRRGAGRGWLTVRVVWIDVALHACAVAVDMGAVLNDRGWSDRVHPCRRRGCRVRD